MFLGHKLRKLREDKGWTTTDIERMTGIPQSRITEMETGVTKNPRPATIEKLCRGLGFKNSDYFFIDEAKLPSEVLPDMPEEAKKFVMSGDNIPYIILSEKAKREGIPAHVLDQLLNTLIEHSQKK